MDITSSQKDFLKDKNHKPEGEDREKKSKTEILILKDNCQQRILHISITYGKTKDKSSLRCCVDLGNNSFKTPSLKYLESDT